MGRFHLRESASRRRLLSRTSRSCSRSNEEQSQSAIPVDAMLVKNFLTLFCVAKMENVFKTTKPDTRLADASPSLLPPRPSLITTFLAPSITSYHFPSPSAIPGGHDGRKDAISRIRKKMGYGLTDDSLSVVIIKALKTLSYG